MTQYAKSNKSTKYTSRSRNVSNNNRRKPAASNSGPKKTIVKKSVKSSIVANTRAIQALSLKQKGTLQQQISFFEAPAGVHVIKNSPWLFHVNDPISGNKGPHMYHINNVQNITNMSGDFALWDDNYGYNQELGEKHFNPPTYLVGVKLEFKVQGFCDNTRVRIDIIRQKKLSTPFFVPQSTGNFLPHKLDKLKGIAGFHPNEINKEFFEIIATRKLFFNSKGSANVADTTADRNTLDATTTNIKYTSIYVPCNKMLKPMDNSTYESTGLQAYDDTQPFKWQNMYPTNNIWCLISTDDETDFASIITGDAISVDIIRKVYWRDPVG